MAVFQVPVYVFNEVKEAYNIYNTIIQNEGTYLTECVNSTLWKSDGKNYDDEIKFKNQLFMKKWNA